jgi:molybdopterin converting factor small subunit
MNKITILAFAGFQRKFGEKNTVISPKGTTVLSILRTFAETIPAACDELFDGTDLRRHVILMYNHERIDTEDAEKIVVSDGDEIGLYPPVSGG